MKELADLLLKVDAASKALRGVSGKQVFSAAIKLQLRDVATQYFSTVQNRAVAAGIDSSELDAAFQAIHAASHINPLKAKMQ